jgi:hypothetical protein
MLKNLDKIMVYVRKDQKFEGINLISSGGVSVKGTPLKPWV